MLATNFMKPKLEYDNEYKSTYVRFLKVREKIAQSIPFRHENVTIVLDVNNDGKLIGVEILNP